MSGTTTNYGWTYPSSTDLAKLGASDIQTLATGVDTTLGTALNNKTHAGLVLVKTQTVGTGVSSVTVTGAFSSTYDNYKVVYTGGVSAANTVLGFKLGSTTTGYYNGIAGVTNASNATLGYNNNATGVFDWAGHANTSNAYLSLEISQPNLAKATIAHGTYINFGNTYVYNMNGFLNNTTQYTDFTIAPTGATTLTGGTIAVYGYAKD